MLTVTQQKLLNLNLSSFPLMAAASVALKKSCSTCPHKSKPDTRGILRTAAIRYQYDTKFKQFLKQHFSLPITIAGITFKD